LSFILVENYLRKKIMSTLNPFFEGVGQILPDWRQIWKFSEFFEVEKTKVVILGQDPYHSPGSVKKYQP
jgi:uracil DNA glycosylase